MCKLLKRIANALERIADALEGRVTTQGGGTPLPPDHN